MISRRRRTEDRRRPSRWVVRVGRRLRGRPSDKSPFRSLDGLCFEFRSTAGLHLRRAAHHPPSWVESCRLQYARKIGARTRRQDPVDPAFVAPVGACLSEGKNHYGTGRQRDPQEIALARELFEFHRVHSLRFRKRIVILNCFRREDSSRYALP